MGRKVSSAAIVRITIFIVFSRGFNLYGQNTIVYPKAFQSNQTDTIWGTVVKDPYRWMEDIKSPEVADWLKAQKKLTDKYSGYPYNIADHIKYYGSIRFHPITRSGKYYFSFHYNSSMDVTPELYYQENPNDDYPDLLFDPNTLGKHADISINDVKMSPDNKTLALMLSKNGSDWKTIRFLNMKKKKLLEDTINFVKYSDMNWYNNGVFYYRYDIKNTDESFSSQIKNKTLYYHILGTKQSEDKLIYRNGDYEDVDFQFFPEDHFIIFQHITHKNGKPYITISISNLNDSLAFRFKDIIASKKDSAYFYILGKLNGKLLVETNLYAPNGAIYKFDPKLFNKGETFIPQVNEQLDFAKLMDNKIVCAYSNDTSSFLILWDSTGKVFHRNNIPSGRTFSHFSGNNDDSILVFAFHSFFTPSTVYTLSLNTGHGATTGMTFVNYDFTGLTTKKVYYFSKDGTKIPMYLTYKTGIKLDGRNPVILYGYGGFGIKMEPFFDPANIIFIRNGGILAVPCLRGGGDLPGWHEKGMRLNKQNTFDDFIAAAEYLVSKHYTTNDKMAAMGGSNGGLLVGAVMLQRPDLFKVVVAEAGVLDMMRYHLFNIGGDENKKEEYGNITDSCDFKNLIKYSPVQNVKNGAKYPATLLVAGDNDDRVNPFHSFKFLAQLQANAACENPYILYYEKSAGHTGSGNIEKNQDTQAFIYAFIFKYLGIQNKISYETRPY